MVTDNEVEYAFNKLKSIPHLRLKKDFDVLYAIDELQLIDEYIGYRKTIDEDYSTSDLYFSNWKGRGLIDFVEDSKLSMMRSPNRKTGIVTSGDGQATIKFTYDENGKIKLFVTDLGKKTRNILDIVYSLTDNPLRTRVTKIMPNGQITWHSHFQNYLGANTLGGDKEYWHCIVHIPLITNPLAEMGVTRFSHKTYGINPVWKHYSVGESWVFNGWHDHNVRNKNLFESRIHIMAYMPLKCRKFMNILMESIEEYNGELIET